MSTDLQVELNAAIVAVEDLTPMILVVPSSSGDPVDGLPFGPFEPLAHRTMEIGLRSWVEEQTRLTLGYVEQLYTFGDRGRDAQSGDTGPHIMSVGYLALARPTGDTSEVLEQSGASWRDWYAYFPWEDWRTGEPSVIAQVIRPKLDQWCKRDPGASRNLRRNDRVRLAFGQEGAPWDEERVLDRYELLYEAGLIEESRRDGRENSARWKPFPKLGIHLRHDHRRILATAISRLRAKLKYRPVVFELMPETFTLTELQHTVEAISGRHLHKQNFRRLVEQGRLVEPAGGLVSIPQGCHGRAAGAGTACRRTTLNSLANQLPKILFVRHGQTDWNRAGRMQGQRDIPLNDRGRRQAERNGRVLKGLIGQANWAVAHSPLSRASETMQIILDNGVGAGSVRQEDDLREIAYGAFEGLTHREINQQFPDQMAERKADKWNFVVPDGESYSGLSKRTWAFLETLSEPTLIVAHGGVMRVILQRLLNMPETEATGLHPPQNQILSIAPSGSVLL